MKDDIEKTSMEIGTFFQHWPWTTGFLQFSRGLSPSMHVELEKLQWRLSLSFWRRVRLLHYRQGFPPSMHDDLEKNFGGNCTFFWRRVDLYTFVVGSRPICMTFATFSYIEGD